MLSFVLIYAVFTKIDPTQVIDYIKTSNPLYIILAFSFIAIAQIYGGLRMRYYMGKEGYIFSKFYSVCFYFIGTFFNILLPGGIGGDGYKAYYFQKNFRVPWQKTILAVIRGRASGLFFLFVFLLILTLIYQKELRIEYLEVIVIVGLLLLFPCYSIAAKYLLKENLSTQIGAFKYSFPIQLSYLLGSAFILFSIEGTYNIIGYLALFQVANIVAVIPISIGGIGLREYTFISLAAYINLDSGVGVAASLMFYIVFVFVALIGLIPFSSTAKLNERESLKFKERNTSDKKHDAEEFEDKFDI